MSAAAAARRSSSIVLETFALSNLSFKTFDPFIACMYHFDKFPAGEPSMGPHPRLLTSRDIGSDFSAEDGWSMYHGRTVPGFPVHPHRGFETVTIVRQGIVDHSDSINGTARYGDGDTQWLTAGKGIQHAEMFPLLHTDRPNPLELFQVWLNLPRRAKMCEPYFGIIWDETAPRATLRDARGGDAAVVRVIAGTLGDVEAERPPPNSWAHDDANDVALWLIDVAPGRAVTLPAARGGSATARAIYFVAGDRLRVSDDSGDASGEDAAATVPMRTGLRVAAERTLRLEAVGDAPASVLLLQGRPIDEPVVEGGPFVMNTQEEIQQSYEDFRRTQFGGWPWPNDDHCHSRDTPRHAVYPDGRREQPPKK